MAESTATGWYYLQGGPGGGQQVGPLSWEQLYGLCSSGSVRPTDMVWHSTMPQWAPAGQVQGLFPAAAGYQAPYQQAPYQQAPYAQTPYQQGPAYQAPYQQAPYQQGWAGAGGYQAPKRRSALTWLIPLIALIVVGAGVGVYFGVFYHKGETGSKNVTAADLAGTWEGTVTYTSLKVEGLSDEDQAMFDKVLNRELPMTMDVTVDEDGKGQAELMIDMTAADESFGTDYETLYFTYEDGKLSFETEPPLKDVSGKVTQRGDTLVWEGSLKLSDEDGSADAKWKAEKAYEPGDSSDEDDQSSDADGEDDQSSDTDGGGNGASTAIASTAAAGQKGDYDLNGTWEGTWTFKSVEAASDQDKWDEFVDNPCPMTMEAELDEYGAGTATLSIDMGDPGIYETHVDFFYTDGELMCTGWDYDVDGAMVFSGVTKQAGKLVWEGSFDYTDPGNLTYTAKWTATKQ